MSRTCAISSCKRPYCALCHCCQQNIYLPHLKEHQDLLVSELNPLIDQINTLGDRLNALSLENNMDDARQKLEQWRVESHQKIDDFFEEKFRELDLHVTGKGDKQREKISRIQSKTAELIREQHATRHDLDLLTSKISDLEREVYQIEQTSFNVRSQSLEIDDSCITIEELGRHRFNLSTLPAVHRTTKYIDGSWHLLAANDLFLLMHQNPNLCLVDRHLKVVKQILWNNDWIYDMCWSSVLDQFIVITPDNVFILDHNTMLIRTFPLIQKQKWLRNACSDTSLFLSTYELSSSIIEYGLLPSIQLIKNWKSPDTCQKNEIISYVRCNNETLALIITEPLNKTIRMELKNSKTLDRLWSLPLNDAKMSKFIFNCCSFNDDEWFIINCGSEDLLHISKQGKIKATYKYQSKPLFASMFGSNILAISTENGLNFHKLQ